MLKSNFFKNKTKQKKKNKKKEYKFSKPFFKFFFNMYAGLGYFVRFTLHINTIHKVWVTLINERQQETRGLLGKKRILWNNPIAGVMSAS